ncbi:hypothetical protein J1605_010925 [Eschrichtius robustus]|uniref:Uncharacterized protein n=1 Tax=Eschrichtius robustus TaxID=9764 RepID=A0AB34GMA3_ESCRO|nr:hypothetical protein J1605_010925 [Eschrichtius robustus]
MCRGAGDLVTDSHLGTDRDPAHGFVGRPLNNCFSYNRIARSSLVFTGPDITYVEAFPASISLFCGLRKDSDFPGMGFPFSPEFTGAIQSTPPAHHTVAPWFSKRGPDFSSSIWELGRNAHSQESTYSGPAEPETLGVRHRKLCVTMPSM